MSNIVFASTKILDAAAPVIGPAFIVESPVRVVQASLAAGTVAVVAIEVSLDGVNFIEQATIALNIDTEFVKSDGYVTTAPWRYVRARVIYLSDGAQVTVFVGV